MTDLPEGWSQVALENLVVIRDSQRVPVNSAERSRRRGSVPYYGATGQVGTIDEALFNEELVLLGEDGVQFFDADRPKAYRISGPAWVNNHAHVLQPLPDRCPGQLLVYFLNQFDYRGRANGTTRLKLTQKAMRDIPVVLPTSPDERAEIVRILDTQLARIDNVLRSVQAVRDKADQFRRSLLHAAFTGQLTQPDPSRGDALPEGWKTVSISNLAGDGPDSLFTDGDWVESKDQDPDGPIRLTQLADVGDGLFRDRSNRWMNCEQAERLGVTFLNENDLLVARMPDPLGRCCLVPKMPYKAVTVVDVAILRVAQANPHLVMHFINSPALRQLIEAESSGTTRRRISRKRLSSIEFPLPPISEQDEIVRILDTQLARIDAAVAAVDRVEVECGRLRRSLLQAAFTGELTRKWRESRV